MDSWMIGLIGAFKAGAVGLLGIFIQLTVLFFETQMLYSYNGNENALCIHSNPKLTQNVWKNWNPPKNIPTPIQNDPPSTPRSAAPISPNLAFILYCDIISGGKLWNGERSTCDLSHESDIKRFISCETIVKFFISCETTVKFGRTSKIKVTLPVKVKERGYRKSFMPFSWKCLSRRSIDLGEYKSVAFKCTVCTNSVTPLIG